MKYNAAAHPFGGWTLVRAALERCQLGGSKAPRGLKPTLLLSLIALTVVLSGCGASASNKAEAATNEQPQNPLEIKVDDELRRQIKIGEPKFAEVAGKLEVAGRIDADATRLARVGSPVAGRITDLLVVEGEHVRRGQVLARLHSTQLSDAQFAFLKAFSQQQVFQRAADRASQLVKADVIGTAELQRRQAEVVQANAELSALRQQLKVLGMSDKAISNLETSHKLNSEYSIVSSIDGTVLDRKITIGQIVQPAEIAFMVADLSNVWMVADIPELNAGGVMVHQAVEAEIPAFPNEKISGRLSFVSATVNPETRTVRVRMNLANPRGRYKPAMLATMTLQDKVQREEVVPLAAIVREENQDHVFVQRGPNTFLLRQIATGEQFGDTRVVKSGLAPGEKIVTDGAFHLNNERKRRAVEGS
jgi:cobalt-zinc-cadmium efflux system membrane fusion protein